MSNETSSMDLNPSLGRRGLFRLGGLTAATVVIAAACSDVSHQLGNVGDANGTTPVLPDPVINDGVLLRTMAGLETSIANAYWALHQQSRDAWTFEMDLRPFGETW